MAVNSMTGFARAQGSHGAVAWTWEARSVNGRGLEVRCKTPMGCDALDLAAREAVARAFKRGNVNLTLSLSRTAEPATMRVNHALLVQLAQLAEEWNGRFPSLAAARLDGLLAVRGVVEPVEQDAPEDDAQRDAREATLKVGLTQVLDALATMRTAEGARLGAVLGAQLDEIERLSTAAGNSATLRPEAMRERLRAQMALILEVVPSVSEERLAVELALLATKADVREELDRLTAHIAAARDMIAQGGAIGRKLDFLCQEFNREANTLCSKSADVELTRIGLDLKAVIEQFREQVQNIE